MSSSNPSSPSDQQRPPLGEIFRKAGKRAIGGGIPGAAAMGAQVVTLMPLRSTMNYQYRYGNSSTVTAVRTLYADGGIRRFYRGIGPALFQGPLSRFGDTAANSGVLTLLDSFDSTNKWPVGAKTAAASGAAAAWRIFLMRELLVQLLRSSSLKTAVLSSADVICSFVVVELCHSFVCSQQSHRCHENHFAG